MQRAKLIIGIVGDVLRHVAIEICKCRHIGWIPAIHSTQLGVLRPQVALDQFGGRQNTQDVGIALGKLLRVRPRQAFPATAAPATPIPCRNERRLTTRRH